MDYSNFEVLDMMEERTQALRKSLPEPPSEETLAAWKLEETRRKLLRDYYDEEDFTVYFTSEGDES